MPIGRRRSPARVQHGYTFVAVLALIAMVSIGLAAAGPSWGERLRREREQELLHVGSLYAQALAQYRDESPGSMKVYPQTLDDLLVDPRFIGLHRHLRRLYPDPLAPRRPWGLVRDKDGRILGVYSQSEDVPVAQGPQARGAVVLAPALRYADWKFLAPT